MRLYRIYFILPIIWPWWSWATPDICSQFSWNLNACQTPDGQPAMTHVEHALHIVQQLLQPDTIFWKDIGHQHIIKVFYEEPSPLSITRKVFSYKSTLRHKKITFETSLLWCIRSNNCIMLTKYSDEYHKLVLIILKILNFLGNTSKFNLANLHDLYQVHHWWRKWCSYFFYEPEMRIPDSTLVKH